MEETINKQVKIFDEVVSQTSHKKGFNIDDTHKIYQEVNKDLRMAKIHEERKNGWKRAANATEVIHIKANGDMATTAQLQAMKNLNIVARAGTTKKEAHKLIGDKIEEIKKRAG